MYVVYRFYVNGCENRQWQLAFSSVGRLKLSEISHQWNDLMGYTFWQGSSASIIGNEFETRVILMSLLLF